jgi:hypothetical protein
MRVSFQRRQRKKIFAALGFFFLFMPALFVDAVHAIPAPGDFDGDGRSDLTVAEVDRAAQSTVWYVRLTSGAPALGYIFPGAADALVTGRFYAGDPRVFPGIVRVVDAAQPLEWTIRNPSGTNNVLRFGLPGDLIPNQGDLDCDGVTDVAVTRNGGGGYYDGFKLWYVALSAKPGAVQEMLFGLAGDHVATADMDGDGCSELLVLRSDFHWYSRKLFQDKVTDVQWGLPGDTPLLPQDLTGDGRADYIVTRNFGAQQYGLLRLSNGSAAMQALGSPTAIPLIGNFIGTPLYAWLERATSFIGVLQGDQSVSVFPFSIPTNWLVRPDGTVVPPLVASAAAAPADSGAGCDGEIDRSDGSGGFKNNPKNSRGTIKVMFPKSFTGNIRRVEAVHQGRVIDVLDEGSTLEWGDRERYYGNDPLRSYPENLLIRVATNSGRAYCVTLPDPAKVYD